MQRDAFPGLSDQYVSRNSVTTISHKTGSLTFDNGENCRIDNPENALVPHCQTVNTLNCKYFKITKVE